jgi:hypothetical protein
MSGKTMEIASPANKREDMSPRRLITKEDKVMTKRILWFVMAPALLFAGAAIAQYPIMNAVADRVVVKYQNSTCEQLWQEKAQKQGQPMPEREQKAVQLLHEDPQMRSAFINKIAAPVLNKMFECRMIP